MKGTTNAMRGEFAKPIVVELLDTAPLVIQLGSKQLKDLYNVSGYAGKYSKEVFTDDNNNLIVSTRLTWTTSGPWSKVRDITVVSFQATSIDLGERYSTNLPAGSIILIKVTGATYPNIEEGYTMICEATVGQNGEITMDLSQTPSFKYWDAWKTSYPEVSVYTEVVGVKQIGYGGGEHELLNISTPLYAEVSA